MYAIGVIMMVVLFGGVFALAWYEIGLRGALSAFGATILICSWIGLAVHLIL